MNIEFTNQAGKVRKLDVLFGTDLEFFVACNVTGKIIPASRVIPGTKGNAHQLEHGVCHPDGISVEVACPPSDTPQGMFDNVDKVIAEVKEKFLDPANVYITNNVGVATSDIDVNLTPKDLEFGCGKELNAYTRNARPSPDRRSNNRYSGFHIHLGFTDGQEETPEVIRDMAILVTALDSAMRYKGVYPNSRRAEQYGGIGAFRVKPYGLEYRALGADNFFQDRAQILNVLNNMGAVFGRTLRIAPDFRSMDENYMGWSHVF